MRHEGVIDENHNRADVDIASEFYQFGEPREMHCENNVLPL